MHRLVHLLSIIEHPLIKYFTLIIILIYMYISIKNCYSYEDEYSDKYIISKNFHFS